MQSDYLIATERKSVAACVSLILNSFEQHWFACNMQIMAMNYYLKSNLSRPPSGRPPVRVNRGDIDHKISTHNRIQSNGKNTADIFCIRSMLWLSKNRLFNCPSCLIYFNLPSTYFITSTGRLKLILLCTPNTISTALNSQTDAISKAMHFFTSIRFCLSAILQL